jgi:hypothetical protein
MRESQKNAELIKRKNFDWMETILNLIMKKLKWGHWCRIEQNWMWKELLGFWVKKNIEDPVWGDDGNINILK